jgi:hypothetical protein
MSKRIEVPEGVQVWKRGSCVPVAMLCLQHLVYPRDLVVEGYVRFRSDWQEHTWMEIDGKIFDPTFIQFRRFKGYPRAERKIKNTFPPPYYKQQVEFAMLDRMWRERVQLFGILPEEIQL